MIAGALVAGRYRVLRRLGSGGMGAVYAAVDEQTEHLRAIKLMHAHTVDRADLRARFELEARIAGRVRCPLLVDVVDAGVDTESETPYLVMELLDGEDLGQRLARRGRLEPAEVVAHLGQVALALERTHAHGVVHRDLKPSNLFVEQREHEPPRIRILDFGVAKVLSDARPSSTAVAGTPMYMAPEQLRGRAVGAGVDIYALGMIAYALLVGVPYWHEERHRDPIAFALVVVGGLREPASVRALWAGAALPAGFDAFFARATAESPARRFPSAIAAVRALAEALDVDSPAWLPEASDEPAPGPAPALEPETSASEALLPAGVTISATPAPAGAGWSGTALAEPATTISGPGAYGPPARSRGRWLVAAAAALALVAGLGAWLLGGPGARSRAPSAAIIVPQVHSPLLAPGSTLACPVLEVVDAPEPAGWLGAAAAGTVCERARVLLGGSPSRTLVPAELLALPRLPVDRFPDDPYSAPDARARSLEAARRRAAVYMDGRVTGQAGAFRLELVLRDAGGAELGRASGEGRALYQAVRAAMEPLEQAALLPPGPVDAAVADYARAADVAGMMGLLDLTLALVQNGGDLDAECERFAARFGHISELALFERHRCAYTLGLEPAAVVLSAAGPATPGALAARARIELVVRQRHDPRDIAQLEERYRVEASPLGRSVLAATLSCLLQPSDPVRAAEWALRAVQAEPKNPIGENCAPWVQLAAVTQGTESVESSLRAMQAWAPWDGYGWLLEAHGAGDGERGLRFARRAYLLSPFDTYVAAELVSKLLARGLREEARAVALALGTSAHPVHRLESEALLMRIEASRARFGAALERARRAMRVAPDDAGWVRVQRLAAAWRALEVALILGREREVADLAVAEFLDPEPPPLDGAHIDVLIYLPAICAYASSSVWPRCFARLDELAGRVAGSSLPETRGFIAGARAYAAGDFQAAARAWRPLLADSGRHVATLAEAMAEVFEATGQPELVERVLDAAARDAGSFNGASLTTVRAALAAGARGDGAEAARLARQVLEAWSVADDDVPALELMRPLAMGELRPGAGR